MHWSLLALGVAAGLGLVLAKQWYERRKEDQELDAIYRQRAAESATAHRAHPHHEETHQTSAVAADVQAAPAAASDAPVAETEPAVSEAGDAEPTEAEPASGSASGAEAVAEPDVKTAAKRDTDVSPQPAVSSEPRTEASPKGTSDGERVEQALASGDLSVMEKALQETGDPIFRNLLLNRLVAGHYRLRSEPEHREAFYRAAHVQIEETSAILNAIEVIGRPRPDRIEAFKSAAIALDEDGRYDEAIAICEKALSLGLEDGTKAGFEGRIARLKKRRDSE